MFELPEGPRKIGAFVPVWRPAGWDPAFHWHHRLLLKPRTLAEWHNLCEELRSISLFSGIAPQVQVLKKPPVCSPKDEDGRLHPWGGRGAAAAYLEVVLEKSQRLRWILRKAVTRFLVAKSRQRVVGDTMDLVTTEPVPKAQQIVVCDLPTRTIYVFHTQTMVRAINQALLNGLFGIPEPRMPRNPYTNVPWSLQQIISIYSQVQVNLASTRNQFMGKLAILFRKHGYDIPTFAQQCAYFLRIVVARAFFADPTAHGWASVYTEILEDIFECLRLQRQYRSVFRRILGRNIDPELQVVWDEMVLGFWYFENYVSVPASIGTSFMDLVVKTRNLYARTCTWLDSQRPPVARARRPVEPKNTDAPEEQAPVRIP